MVVGRVVIAFAVGAALVGLVPPDQAAVAAAAEHDVVVVDLGDDIVAPPDPPASSHFRQFAAGVPTDPLGLVENLDQIRLYTSGTDTYEVWKCGNSFDLSTKVSEANTFITPYYEWLSDGAYSPVFVQGGTVTGTDCQDPLALENYIAANSSGTANAALSFVDGAGGFAGPGVWCFFPCSDANKKFPNNARYGQVGISVAFRAVLAHELGHMLHWPHSFTDVSGSEYDNALDVMSGNFGVVGCCTFGTYPEPFATLGINRYAAGWIDTSDVTVHDDDETEVVLQEIGDSGTEMLIIHGDGGYWTLDTRVKSADDVFQSAWSGVHVAWIDDCVGCWGTTRRTVPEPPVPFDWTNFPAAYNTPLPHVLQAGDTLIVDTHTIEILAREGDAFRVSVISTRFIDVPANHTFYDDVEYLAVEAITLGCNPPSNTLYCPNNNVTRGQMAAFLVRALGLTDDGGGNTFIDDDGSIFEADIAKLAAAGITKGCNPPVNDRYCPDNNVNREQMAAFLVRALGLTDDGGGNTFIDDDGSIFEADIAKLAATGITLGCNPPVNNMFCPKNNVTRQQMAAFLHRALT